MSIPKTIIASPHGLLLRNLLNDSKSFGYILNTNKRSIIINFCKCRNPLSICFSTDKTTTELHLEGYYSFDCYECGNKKDDYQDDDDDDNCCKIVTKFCGESEPCFKKVDDKYQINFMCKYHYRDSKFVTFKSCGKIKRLGITLVYMGYGKNLEPQNDKDEVIQKPKNIIKFIADAHPTCYIAFKQILPDKFRRPYHLVLPGVNYKMKKINVETCRHCHVPIFYIFNVLADDRDKVVLIDPNAVAVDRDKIQLLIERFGFVKNYRRRFPKLPDNIYEFISKFFSEKDSSTYNLRSLEIFYQLSFFFCSDCGGNTKKYRIS